jgi:hypothetical protein
MVWSTVKFPSEETNNQSQIGCVRMNCVASSQRTKAQCGLVPISLFFSWKTLSLLERCTTLMLHLKSLEHTYSFQISRRTLLFLCEILRPAKIRECKKKRGSNKASLKIREIGPFSLCLIWTVSLTTRDNGRKQTNNHQLLAYELNHWTVIQNCDSY